MRASNTLPLLTLCLSPVYSASLGEGGRPQRPPLIWKWLSGASTAQEVPTVVKEAEDRVDVEEEPSNTLIETTTRRASLEDVADLGFRLTGVYISPDSILNPVKWATLFYNLLPYSKGSAATREGVSLNLELDTGEPYASEAIGGLADKEYGMANTLACSATSLLKSGLDLYCETQPAMCPTKTMVLASKMGLDVLCHGITIGKVADTFRSGSCKKDDDCPDIDDQEYTCNISRGVCEIKA